MACRDIMRGGCGLRSRFLILNYATMTGHLLLFGCGWMPRYAYEKLGSCALLAMIEPLTGQRLAQVHPQRTKREYTLFCQAVAAKYPNAIKIRMVQDNLNTHDTSAFYENLPADKALALAERFEFYYTPKSASWLNMIEIEFSALSRQCLNRRIPTIEKLQGFRLK